MEIFTPYRSPVIAPSRAAEPRVRSAKFGDGYSQRTGDGLNTDEQSWSLQWIGSPADIDSVEAFFDARAGVEAFLWTAPRESTAKKWLCPKWQRDFLDRTTDRLSTTFERSFDLG